MSCCVRASRSLEMWIVCARRRPGASDVEERRTRRDEFSEADLRIALFMESSFAMFCSCHLQECGRRREYLFGKAIELEEKGKVEARKIELKVREVKFEMCGCR